MGRQPRKVTAFWLSAHLIFGAANLWLLTSGSSSKRLQQHLTQDSPRLSTSDPLFRDQVNYRPTRAVYCGLIRDRWAQLLCMIFAATALSLASDLALMGA